MEHCIGHEANVTLGLEALPARQLCFLAFLPHILDSGASGRNAYLKVPSGLGLTCWNRVRQQGPSPRHHASPMH